MWVSKIMLYLRVERKRKWNMSQKRLCKTKTQIEELNLQTRYRLTTTKGPTWQDIKSSVLKWREEKKKTLINKLHKDFGINYIWNLDDVEARYKDLTLMLVRFLLICFVEIIYTNKNLIWRECLVTPGLSLSLFERDLS